MPEQRHHIWIAIGVAKCRAPWPPHVAESSVRELDTAMRCSMRRSRMLAFTRRQLERLPYLRRRHSGNRQLGGCGDEGKHERLKMLSSERKLELHDLDSADRNHLNEGEHRPPTSDQGNRYSNQHVVLGCDGRRAKQGKHHADTHSHDRLTA